MCFDVHSCLSSRESFSWAAECCRIPFSAGVSISGVVIVIWVLDEALDAIPGVFAAAAAAVVGGDVAVAFGRSSCRTGGKETSWGDRGAAGRLLDLRLRGESRSVE